MRSIMRYVAFLFMFSFLISCENRKKEHVESLLQTWTGKEVLLPQDLIFTVGGKDTVNFSTAGKFKIFTYVDSVGCVSCKLQ